MADRYALNAVYGCPCPDTYRGRVPKFVGKDFFCETGNYGHWNYNYHTQNPLWDGKGYGTFSNCDGSGKKNPWFKKTFPYTIYSDVELRVCLDAGRRDEDFLIEQIHIYVQ